MSETTVLTLEQAREVAFAISRTFDAPRELVFRVWSQAEHLARWWGPTGCEIGIAGLDFTPGGAFHYSMRTPDGHTMWGKFVYRDIAPVERLVFVSSFSDEAGNVVRAPFSPVWPLEVLSTLTFAESGDGKTAMTLHAVPINATAAECHAFKEMHGSMQQGWAGTLAQLAAYLETQTA